MANVPATNGAASPAALEDVDKPERAPYILTFSEVKLLGIAGVRSFYSHGSYVADRQA
jgi:hypothetical protein